MSHNIPAPMGFREVPKEEFYASDMITKMERISTTLHGSYPYRTEFKHEQRRTMGWAIGYMIHPGLSANAYFLPA